MQKSCFLLFLVLVVVSTQTGVYAQIVTVCGLPGKKRLTKFFETGTFHTPDNVSIVPIRGC
jgi:hypothetical protein